MALVPLAAARRTYPAGPDASLPHVKGLKIGSRKTIRIDSETGAALTGTITKSHRMARIETADGSVYYRYADGSYYRYKCLCRRCKVARGHIKESTVPAAGKVIPKKILQAVKVTARQMSALRKTHAGGGYNGLPLVEHAKGLPIGSRQSSRAAGGYLCKCLACRIDRGQYKEKERGAKTAAR